MVTENRDDACPIHYTLNLIGPAWTLLVLRELLREPEMRFSELRRSLTGVSAKVLAARLRSLIEAGVVAHLSAGDGRPHNTYALTARGHSLRPILAAMVVWGRSDRNEFVRNMKGVGEETQ